MKFSILYILTLISFVLNAQFKNLEKPFFTYKIPSKECVAIQHSSGSRIFIPTNAFNLTEEENTDSLTLYYREFFEPIDFLTNKLDLHFQNSFLVSGGMFEILIKKGDRIVFLNENKEIKVDLIKKNNQNVFNEFFYNTKNKEWIKNTTFNEEIETEDWVNESFSIDTLWQLNTLTQEEELVFVTPIPDNPLFQSMKISNYGLYNYDYLMKDENAIPLIVDFKLKHSKFISTVYIIYDDLNTLIYYTENDFKEKFRLLDNKQFTIFGITNSHKIVKWNKPNNFNLKALENKKYTFTLSETSKNYTTIDELKEQIGI